MDSWRLEANNRGAAPVSLPHAKTTTDDRSQRNISFPHVPTELPTLYPTSLARQDRKMTTRTMPGKNRRPQNSLRIPKSSPFFFRILKMTVEVRSPITSTFDKHVASRESRLGTANRFKIPNSKSCDCEIHHTQNKSWIVHDVMMANVNLPRNSSTILS